MDADDVIRFVSGLPETVVMTADEAGGAPEAAWGDSFFFHAPDGEEADQRFPFATLVVSDYDGFDTASALNRPGVFALNINVGRTGFHQCLGYPPAAHAEHHARIDYTAADRILPHPVYAAQGWIRILNPGEATGELARSLLRAAHARAAGRRRARRPDSGEHSGGPRTAAPR